MKSTLFPALAAGAVLAIFVAAAALRPAPAGPDTVSPVLKPAAAHSSRPSLHEDGGKTPRTADQAVVPASSGFSRPPATALAPPVADSPPPRFTGTPPPTVPASPSLAANFRVITHSPGDVEIELDDRAVIPAVFASVPVPVATTLPPDPAGAARAEKIAALEDRIADDFIRDVSSKSAAEPLTLEQYEEAADLADDRLRSLLGVEEYKARALRAAKEGLKQRAR